MGSMKTYSLLKKTQSHNFKEDDDWLNKPLQDFLLSVSCFF